MTKAQIIERLKAAGVTGWDKKNLAELEAMAEAAGVSLVDATGDPEETETPAEALEAVPAESSKPTPSFAEATDGGESGAPAEEYNPARIITPQEACSYHSGDPES